MTRSCVGACARRQRPSCTWKTFEHLCQAAPRPPHPLQWMHRRERAMAQKVADQFADVLVAAGVKRIYGIVGDSLNGLTDSLRRQGKIEWIHVRHEEAAAFAAAGEAHLTGARLAFARRPRPSGT